MATSLERVKQLLEQLQGIPAIEREAWLDRECEGLPVLRAELSSLLRFHPVRASRSEPPFADGGGEERAQHLSPGELVADRYRVVELRGRGSHGEVYLVHDRQASSERALKVLHPERRFSEVGLTREVRMLRRVQHPAVVRFFEAFEDRGRLCLTMEFVDGLDLATLLRQVGRIAPWRLREIALELSAGLGAAHDLGIVHRDVKPANVLVDRDGHVRISDFALAASVGEDAADFAMGTPLYMAPEQLGDASGITPRSDVYSLAVLLYEAITGHAPFSGQDLLEILERKLEGPPRPPSRDCPDLPRDLEEAILAGLDRDPTKRPRSGAAFADRLGRSEDRVDVFPQRGERRLLTVMSVSAAPRTRKPAAGSLAPLIEQASRAVSANGGHVALASHDSVLAYFGFPVTREDDIDRAIRATRDLLGTNSEEDHASNPDFRVGIDSGGVLLDRVAGGPELLAFGDVAAHAERLRRAAGDGEALLGSETLSGARDPRDFEEEDWLRCEDPDARPASRDGRQPPQRSWQLSTRDASFVGRQEEIETLFALWSHARDVAGQVVTVLGEPGIGKTRLVHELRDRVSADAPRWLEVRGVEADRSTPFRALKRLLERHPELGNADASGESRNELASALDAAGRSSGLDLPPGTAREASIPALVRDLIGHGPTILHCEDVQWLDASTLDVLAALAARLEASPVLLLATGREDCALPWPSDDLITLQRLAHDQAALIVDEVDGGGDLAESGRDRILERAEGVPLFLEALAEQWLRSPVAEALPPQLPIRLRGLLEARLDRLGRAKRVAQLGACIGTRFSRALLEAVTGGSRESSEDLDHLVDSGVFRSAEERSGVVYEFQHALLAEAARESLPEDQRREAHAAIAWSLLQLDPDALERSPERVAHHLARSRAADTALEAWERARAAAADRAEQRDAS